jgi:hypothetical protein
MRKTYIYIFCLIVSFSAIQLQAQNCWSPLGSGVVFDRVVSMLSYNNSLIVAGWFDSIGGIPASNIAKWNGSTWSNLGEGLRINPSHSTTIPYVASLIEYNGDLYAAGQFDSAGGVPVNNIARWDGTSWSAVGSGILGTSYTIDDMAVYNGALYAAGRFDSAGGNLVNSIAKWDGTQWSDIGGGVSAIEGVFCLMTYNGLLYVGGSFFKTGNAAIQNVATWNDTTWSPLGNGVGNNNQEILALAFNRGILYTSVFQLAAPYTDSLATWDGTTWVKQIGVSVTNNDYGIQAFYSFNGNLIAGGGFDSIGNVAANDIALWDGLNWSEFGGGFNPPLGAVTVMETYNSNLYVAGYFTRVDSVSANSIAEYTCATDGIHEVSTDHVHVYPNPTTGMINISIDNAEAGSSVQIYDLLGQKIFQSSISSDNTSIDLSGHAAGSYLYHISGSVGESISAGTLIIQ